MHLAVAHKNLPIVRVLDQYNADASIQNVDRMSAIDVAVQEDFK